LTLGYVGAHPPAGTIVVVGQLATFYYFLHFLVLIPLIGKIERPRPLPTSIGAAVLGPAGAAGGTDMPRFVLAVAAVLALAAGSIGIARAQEEAPPAPHQQWSFEGVFGTYDEAALQRGYQVYKEVCSACHAVKHLYYRDLSELGYSDDQVKGIAAQFQVTDGPNDQATCSSARESPRTRSSALRQ